MRNLKAFMYGLVSVVIGGGIAAMFIASVQLSPPYVYVTLVVLVFGLAWVSGQNIMEHVELQRGQNGQRKPRARFLHRLFQKKSSDKAVKPSDEYYQGLVVPQRASCTWPNCECVSMSTCKGLKHV